MLNEADGEIHGGLAARRASDAVQGKLADRALRVGRLLGDSASQMNLEKTMLGKKMPCPTVCSDNTCLLWNTDTGCCQLCHARDSEPPTLAATHSPLSLAVAALVGLFVGSGLTFAMFRARRGPPAGGEEPLLASYAAANV
jgi:hypothetical protein